VLSEDTTTKPVANLRYIMLTAKANKTMAMVIVVQQHSRLSKVGIHG